MGYANVWEYGEGNKAWIAAGLPVEGRSSLRINAYYATRRGLRSMRERTADYAMRRRVI
jgi:hypothetical protein